MLGERLSQLTSFEGLKLTAGTVLLSPFLPLLFMGEEYGETAPFQYFMSHTDPGLIKAVRKGRREEFAAFRWQGEAPDPQDEATFQRCKLDHALRHQGHHQILLDFYTVLLQLRREVPALAHLSKNSLDIVGYEKEKVLFIRRWHGKSEVCIILSFNAAPVSLALPIPVGYWNRRVDSTEERWQGRGSALPVQLESDGAMTLALSPRTFGVFVREGR
jgi:maltooligosyltrehalose trehalohydrolase